MWAPSSLLPSWTMTPSSMLEKREFPQYHLLVVLLKPNFPGMFRSHVSCLLCPSLAFWPRLIITSRSLPETGSHIFLGLNLLGPNYHNYGPKSPIASSAGVFSRASGCLGWSWTGCRGMRGVVGYIKPCTFPFTPFTIVFRKLKTQGGGTSEKAF